jgi:hypothetical protein
MSKNTRKKTLSVWALSLCYSFKEYVTVEELVSGAGTIEARKGLWREKVGFTGTLR